MPYTESYYSTPIIPAADDLHADRHPTNGALFESIFTLASFLVQNPEVAPAATERWNKLVERRLVPFINDIMKQTDAFSTDQFLSSSFSDIKTDSAPNTPRDNILRATASAPTSPAQASHAKEASLDTSFDTSTVSFDEMIEANISDTKDSISAEHINHLLTKPIVGKALFCIFFRAFYNSLHAFMDIEEFTDKLKMTKNGEGKTPALTLEELTAQFKNEASTAQNKNPDELTPEALLSWLEITEKTSAHASTTKYRQLLYIKKLQEKIYTYPEQEGRSRKMLSRGYQQLQPGESPDEILSNALLLFIVGPKNFTLPAPPPGCSDEQKELISRKREQIKYCAQLFSSAINLERLFKVNKAAELMQCPLGDDNNLLVSYRDGNVLNITTRPSTQPMLMERRLGLSKNVRLLNYFPEKNPQVSVLTQNLYTVTESAKLSHGENSDTSTSPVIESSTHTPIIPRPFNHCGDVDLEELVTDEETLRAFYGNKANDKISLLEAQEKIDRAEQAISLPYALNPPPELVAIYEGRSILSEENAASIADWFATCKDNVQKNTPFFEDPSVSSGLNTYDTFEKLEALFSFRKSLEPGSELYQRYEPKYKKLYLKRMKIEEDRIKLSPEQKKEQEEEEQEVMTYFNNALFLVNFIDQANKDNFFTRQESQLSRPPEDKKAPPSLTPVAREKIRAAFNYYHSLRNSMVLHLPDQLYRLSLKKATTEKEKEQITRCYATHLAHFAFAGDVAADDKNKSERENKLALLQWKYKIDFCIQNACEDLLQTITLKSIEDPCCADKSKLLIGMLREMKQAPKALIKKLLPVFFIPTLYSTLNSEIVDIFKRQDAYNLLDTLSKSLWNTIPSCDIDKIRLNEVQRQLLPFNVHYDTKEKREQKEENLLKENRELLFTQFPTLNRLAPEEKKAYREILNITISYTKPTDPLLPKLKEVATTLAYTETYSSFEKSLHDPNQAQTVLKMLRDYLTLVSDKEEAFYKNFPTYFKPDLVNYSDPYRLVMGYKKENEPSTMRNPSDMEKMRVRELRFVSWITEQGIHISNTPPIPSASPPPSPPKTPPRDTLRSMVSAVSCLMTIRSKSPPDDKSSSTSSLESRSSNSSSTSTSIYSESRTESSKAMGSKNRFHPVGGFVPGGAARMSR